MIQVLNIVSGKYTTNPTVDFNLSNVFNTKDNIYKMQLTHMHYNLPGIYLERPHQTASNQIWT